MSFLKRKRKWRPSPPTVKERDWFTARYPWPDWDREPKWNADANLTNLYVELAELGDRVQKADWLVKSDLLAKRTDELSAKCLDGERCIVQANAPWAFNRPPPGFEPRGHRGPGFMKESGRAEATASIAAQAIRYAEVGSRAVFGGPARTLRVVNGRLIREQPMFEAPDLKTGVSPYLWDRKTDYIPVGLRGLKPTGRQPVRARRPAGGSSVYKGYGADGTLLYVGMTMRGMRRQREHSQHSAWWPEVQSITVEHFDTREQALAHEAWLIRTEHPIYNIQLQERRAQRTKRRKRRRTAR